MNDIEKIILNQGKWEDLFMFIKKGESWENYSKLRKYWKFLFKIKRSLKKTY